jgi:hypothetical protein
VTALIGHHRFFRGFFAAAPIPIYTHIGVFRPLISLCTIPLFLQSLGISKMAKSLVQATRQHGKVPPFSHRLSSSSVCRGWLRRV